MTTATIRSLLRRFLLIHLAMIRISAAAAAASRRTVPLTTSSQRHAARPAAAAFLISSRNSNNQHSQHREIQSCNIGLLQRNQPRVRELQQQQQQQQPLFSQRILLCNGRSGYKHQPFSTSSSICRPFTTATTTRSMMSKNDDDNVDDNDNDGFFASNVLDFKSMGITSPVLLKRLKAMGLQRPTAVQAAAYQAIDTTSSIRTTAGTTGDEIQDVTIGSETGSGKTLSYLLPLINDILERKQKQASSASDSHARDIGLGYDYARAIILVPNKELVQQLVRMALPLAGGGDLVYGNISNDASFGRTATSDDDNNNIPSHERVRMAIFPGGLMEPMDFQPFRQRLMMTPAGKSAEPPVDLIMSTPAALGPLGLSPKNIDMFADISTLVVDEADMLLDGGYIRDLENVLMGFRRADRLVNANASWGTSNVDNQDETNSSSSSSSSSSSASSATSLSSFMGTRTQHVFVAATLPDFGLRSVDAYLQKRFPRAVRVTMAGMHQARHSGLQAQTVWIYEESKKGRMQQLAEMLKTPPQQHSSINISNNGLLGAKVMVFLNSVDDVEGASQALSRAGINALPYHAKLSLEERTKTLDRFRKYKSSNKNDNKMKDNDDRAVPVLVCTDLAARGLDVPGVDVVVQLQFATNVVSHLHRIGRCGRINDNVVGEGRGIVFYGSTEKDLVRVVQEAEAQQERMILEGVEVDPTVQEYKDGDDVDSSTATTVTAAGSVKNAFSRKRGFTKKRKKLKREANTEGGAGGNQDT